MSEESRTGRERLEERANQYGDDLAGRLADHPRRTVGGIMLKVVLVILAITAFFSVIGFFAGWFNAAKDVVSPANVKQQYSDAYTRYESLKVLAGNACDAAKSLPTATTSDGGQLDDPAFAIRARYRQVAGEYDAAYDNAFQAKHVGPRDLPRKAPSLKEMEKQVC